MPCNYPEHGKQNTSGNQGRHDSSSDTPIQDIDSTASFMRLATCIVQAIRQRQPGFKTTVACDHAAPPISRYESQRPEDIFVTDGSGYLPVVPVLVRLPHCRQNEEDR